MIQNVNPTPPSSDDTLASLVGVRDGHAKVPKRKFVLFVAIHEKRKDKCRLTFAETQKEPRLYREVHSTVLLLREGKILKTDMDEAVDRITKQIKSSRSESGNEQLKEPPIINGSRLSTSSMQGYQEPIDAIPLADADIRTIKERFIFCFMK